MLQLEPDELLVLREYQKLRDQKHGDLEISIKDGKLVKLWKVEKVDLANTRPMREVPGR